MNILLRAFLSKGQRIAVIAVLPMSIQHGLSCSPCPDPSEPPPPLKLAPPPAGMLYHSAYPDLGGWEDEVSTQKILDFQTLSHKKLVWAYASNN